MTSEKINQLCIETLTKAKLKGRVAVIGSGPSSPYIAPVEKLKELLQTRCGITCDPSLPFWELSEQAFSNNPDEYYNVLREAYDSTPQWTSRTYSHLVRMPFLGFVTLNYDEQLPLEFLNQHRGVGNFSVYPPADGQRYRSPLEFLSRPRRLIALHGYCDRKNAGWEKQVILKTSDYNQHYIEPPAPLFHWWTNLLLSIPCIFIGTSLREPGLFRVMEELLPEHRDRLLDLKHLHLVSAHPDPVTGTYRPPRTYLGAIQQVFYDPLDKYHNGLLHVLSAFSGLLTDRPSPRLLAPKKITAVDSINFDAL